MLDTLDRAASSRALAPLVHGAAKLGAMAFQGQPLAVLLNLIGPPPAGVAEGAAWLLDRSFAHAMCFQPEEAAVLQAEALAMTQTFRIRGGHGPRVLVLMAPGNLMVNAPLGFLTCATDLQLELMYLCPHLPSGPLPGHDVAINAISELAPLALSRLLPQFAAWPRPILNDPSQVLRLSRDDVAARLAPLPGVATAPTVRASRSLLATRGPALLADGAFPVLLRPLDSHGGAGLVRCDNHADISAFLAIRPGDDFFISRFIDYRGPDGWFRKYRIAMVDGAPFLCHMAASDHWMAHYLSAGMVENPAKRAAEAAAMATFDAGFAQRHGSALAALAHEIKLDYFSIDCTEAPDGRLLVFEVDVAAIIHHMDPPLLYPYKRAPMQRCADAFAAMVARRS